MHQCLDCGAQFFSPGESSPPMTSLAAQCPDCQSYRTQPGGIPDEENDMLNGIGAMPNQDQQDDMSGNPLQEGILGNQGGDGGWQNRMKRDESFASVRRAKVSLFETPEFETESLLLPPDLYRDAMKTEAAHRTSVQIPKGITDNLHAALGNLQAWTENPYENGELRPYYNKYWQVIRPSFMKPGSLQIGVADPTMAEIINHVAQTDDLTPLYEYRGENTHTSGFLAPLMGVAGDVAAGASLSDAVGGAMNGIGGGIGAGGVGGLMQKAMGGGAWEAGKAGMGQVLGLGDDLAGGAAGTQGGQSGPGGVPGAVNSPNFYAGGAKRAAFDDEDEDSTSPNSHGEIPKNEDGDSHQKVDGDHKDWQKDFSVNDMGGTDQGGGQGPTFDMDGPGMQRFKMLLPLIQQLIENGEDGSQDPLIQGLHQTLEAEVPGYLDHADDNAAHELLLVLGPNGKPEGDKPSPEKNDEDHTDENSGGKRESRVAGLHLGQAEGGDFLADIDVAYPSLNGVRVADTQGPTTPEQIQAVQQWLLQHGQQMGLEGDELTQTILSVPTNPLEFADILAEITKRDPPPAVDGQSAAPPQPAQEQAPPGATMPMPGMDSPQPTMSHRVADLETSPEMEGTPDPLRGGQDDQVMQMAKEMMARGIDPETAIANAQARVGDVQVNGEGAQAPEYRDPMQAPYDFERQIPPQLDAWANPGLERNYGKTAADSVAKRCPKCKSHTTKLINAEDGTSMCHACKHVFKTEGIIPQKLESSWSPMSASQTGNTTWNGTFTPIASTWNVDEDFRKEADIERGPDTPDVDSAPVQGVPIADQVGQEDGRHEEDSGHTWTDEDGNPLKVGQEYQMYSDKYEIPDLVRIEAVKPHSIVYTLMGEFGLDQTAELTKEEANIDRTSFQATQEAAQPGLDDGLERNNDDNDGYSGEPEQSDMSAPFGQAALTSSHIERSVMTSGVNRENPDLAWLKSAGANYTPMEQRALIDERGEARNSGLLDLSGTHYIQDAEEDQFLFGL